jgi:hypothetical protein
MGNAIVTLPAYLTFTGVDSAESIPAMRALSARYPIEWGVLFDPGRRGEVLFPDAAVRDAIARAGVRLSVHVCGDIATAIVLGRNPAVQFAGFSRLQINHGRAGSTAEQIRNGRDFAARQGMRAVLQCQGAFPQEEGVDWLFDVSFGTGAAPREWPPLSASQPFCGYSGGLGPNNVRGRLASAPVAAGVSYWIDMESGVRTEGRFDTAKCAAVCEAVFGP